MTKEASSAAGEAKTIAIAATSFCKSITLMAEARRAFAGHTIVWNENARELTEAEVIALCQGADAAIIGREKISARVLERLPNLKLISKYGVGLDNLDLPELDKRGIVLYAERGVNRFAVAELTVGLALGLMRNIARSDRCLRSGEWLKSGGEQLSGRSVALVGCGAVGAEVARILRAFSCKLLICDIVDKTALAKEVDGLIVDYDGALCGADIISFHVPLTPQTAHMFDKRAVEKVRPGTWILNTARGGVIDETALLAGLHSGKIAGAACDVFEQEPPTCRELLEMPNFLGTAHIAGNSREAVEAMGGAAIRGITRFLLQ